MNPAASPPVAARPAGAGHPPPVPSRQLFSGLARSGNWRIAQRESQIVPMGSDQNAGNFLDVVGDTSPARVSRCGTYLGAQPDDRELQGYRFADATASMSGRGMGRARRDNYRRRGGSSPRLVEPLSGPCCVLEPRPFHADGGHYPEGCGPRSTALSAAAWKIADTLEVDGWEKSPLERRSPHRLNGGAREGAHRRMPSRSRSSERPALNNR